MSLANAPILLFTTSRLLDSQTYWLLVTEEILADSTRSRSQPVAHPWNVTWNTKEEILADLPRSKVNDKMAVGVKVTRTAKKNKEKINLTFDMDKNRTFGQSRNAKGRDLATGHERERRTVHLPSIREWPTQGAKR